MDSYTDLLTHLIVDFLDKIPLVSLSAMLETIANTCNIMVIYAYNTYTLKVVK